MVHIITSNEIKSIVIGTHASALPKKTLEELDRMVNCAQEILKKVGLENRTNHKPSELSGGERQRVAIARAMITEPACLMADEPTGNLDATNAREVLDLIIELNKNRDTALLIVTHDLSIANKMERKFDLTNGILVEK